MLGGKTVDAAEPPRIVFERPAPCRESDGPADLLKRALAPTLAPGPGWTVSMRVDRADRSSLRAEGEVAREDGVVVARRTMAGANADCGALARAVGVWAALVLDAEMQRAGGSSSPTLAAAAASAGPTPIRSAAIADGGTVDRSESAPAAAPGNTDSKASDAGGQPRPASAEGGPPSESGDRAIPWPAPAVAEAPSPEYGWYIHHDDTRALELGAGMFLMTGTGGGAVAGPTAFVVIEAGPGVFLRPALAFGESLTSLPPADVNAARWMDARFDTCLRLPGLYTRHHGMQLDLCGGSDLGATTIESGTGTTLPYLNVGPSMGMRGELGSRLSAVLRVVAGINLIRDSFVDLSGAREAPPVAAGRLELAFSWDVR
jgi:hypothetical protein